MRSWLALLAFLAGQALALAHAGEVAADHGHDPVCALCHVAETSDDGDAPIHLIVRDVAPRMAAAFAPEAPEPSFRRSAARPRAPPIA